MTIPNQTPNETWTIELTLLELKIVLHALSVTAQTGNHHCPSWQTAQSLIEKTGLDNLDYDLLVQMAENATKQFEALLWEAPLAENAIIEN